MMTFDDYMEEEQNIFKLMDDAATIEDWDLYQKLTDMHSKLEDEYYLQDVDHPHDVDHYL